MVPIDFPLESPIAPRTPVTRVYGLVDTLGGSVGVTPGLPVTGSRLNLSGFNAFVLWIRLTQNDVGGLSVYLLELDPNNNFAPFSLVTATVVPHFIPLGINNSHGGVVWERLWLSNATSDLWSFTVTWCALYLVASSQQANIFGCDLICRRSANIGGDA